MMLVHKWVEHYSHRPLIQDILVQLTADAIQFDCGPVDDIPIGKAREFFEARAPFPSTLLQFELPSNPEASHAIVLWSEQNDGSVRFIATWRRRHDKEWFSCAPTTVTRNGDGSFQYARIGHDERNQEFVMRMHAWALNLFYIIGCSNVSTQEYPAPTALNKKRLASGKLPIHSHKTLVLVVDQQKTKGPDMGGTHASPRVHLRRGHIRRLDDQRRVWVQPCVVGSHHGLVTKTYRIDQHKGRHP